VAISFERFAPNSIHDDVHMLLSNEDESGGSMTELELCALLDELEQQR